ncbi:IPExxxVDY family protein [Oceanihabitans sp. 2_MG-2023]|uniref:IPExxxVDY family protein n=1 Tax=Oceanihabitans sp. 2_MG-2023 TaxID=3062661 RepID=UPI0026E2AF4E|nr:IPExxxVDY family protein [Oceanihabitans sp. 2_MG-2023]MDO6595757.1 IPExxxVDY family protein [Oceanihabitans sp. 2_MG-2023]
MRKLILEDFIEDIDYALIGIHCSIEDYRLAYLLNKHLGLNLTRKTVDIEYKDTSSYSIFEWEDEKQLTIWNLVSNISKIEVSDTVDVTSLFINEEKFTKTKHLIPEYKKVNFILKISEDPNQHLEKQALNKILEIPQVVTAFGIDANKLKTTDQLIFN